MADNIEETDKIHLIKSLIANSGFHMRQVVAMPTEAFAEVNHDDEI